MVYSLRLWNPLHTSLTCTYPLFLGFSLTMFFITYNGLEISDEFLTVTFKKLTINKIT